jgi:hypothetical protein
MNTFTQPKNDNIEVLREKLELQRRAKIHREIGALETQLKNLAAGSYAARTRTYFKLRSKIRRKQWELRQPMLVSLTG